MYVASDMRLIEQIIELRDLDLEARSYLCLAESLLATSTREMDTTTQQRTKHFLEAAQRGTSRDTPLIQGFYSTGDLEAEMQCLRKLTQILADVGHIQARDIAARRYLALKAQIAD
jgi:hypothetical protein